MCQTNKSGGIKMEAQSCGVAPAGECGSVNLRPLLWLRVGARVITYPPSTLSLSGAILVLFSERAPSITSTYEICSRQSFRSGTQNSISYENGNLPNNQIISRRVVALHDFLFLKHPITLVCSTHCGPAAFKGTDMWMNVTLIDGFGHMRWQNMFWESGADYNSEKKNTFFCRFQSLHKWAHWERFYDFNCAQA